MRDLLSFFFALVGYFLLLSVLWFLNSRAHDIDAYSTLNRKDLADVLNLFVVINDSS